MKRILNVGSGLNTYGTDFIDLYPLRKEVIKCDVSKEKFPYQDNTFDEVYSSFLFEHLPNPGIVLKEMYRILKPDGKIELHTNNAGWIFYHNSKSKTLTHYGGYEDAGKKKEHLVGGEDDKHYSLYTFHHLINHFEDAGFVNIKTELYRKNPESWRIILRIINWLIGKTRFKWASYPQIKVEATK